MLREELDPALGTGRLRRPVLVQVPRPLHMQAAPAKVQVTPLQAGRL